MNDQIELPTFDEVMEVTKGRWLDMSVDEKEVVVTELVPRMRILRHQRQLEESWHRLCPPIYRESDPKRLPNLRMFEEVQKWEYGPEGLLLIGPSRRGKTRAVWALLKRLHFQEERKILAFGPKDLKAAVANEWRDRDDDEPDLTSQLRHAELLFLDDLDTIKFTEAVEETLYDTFEDRLAYGRPVILTLNQSGPELARRMSTEARGEKITRRMRESCKVIAFG